MEALAQEASADVQHNEAGDDGRVTLDAAARLRMQKRGLTHAQRRRPQNESAPGQGQHAHQDGDRQDVPAQTVQIPQAPPAQEDQAGQEPLQDVADVDEQVVSEPPDDEGVEQAGQRARSEDGQKRDRLDQNADQTARDQAPVGATAAAP